jgi:hypothetical protein
MEQDDLRNLDNPQDVYYFQSANALALAVDEYIRKRTMSIIEHRDDYNRMALSLRHVADSSMASLQVDYSAPDSPFFAMNKMIIHYQEQDRADHRMLSERGYWDHLYYDFMRLYWGKFLSTSTPLLVNDVPDTPSNNLTRIIETGVGMPLALVEARENSSSWNRNSQTYARMLLVCPYNPHTFNLVEALKNNVESMKFCAYSSYVHGDCNLRLRYAGGQGCHIFPVLVKPRSFYLNDYVRERRTDQFVGVPDRDGTLADERQPADAVILTDRDTMTTQALQSEDLICREFLQPLESGIKRRRGEGGLGESRFRSGDTGFDEIRNLFLGLSPDLAFIRSQVLIAVVATRSSVTASDLVKNLVTVVGTLPHVAGLGAEPTLSELYSNANEFTQLYASLQGYGLGNVTRRRNFQSFVNGPHANLA